MFMLPEFVYSLVIIRSPRVVQFTSVVYAVEIREIISTIRP